MDVLGIKKQLHTNIVVTINNSYHQVIPWLSIITNKHYCNMPQLHKTFVVVYLNYQQYLSWHTLSLSNICCCTSRNQSKKELVFIIIKIQKRLEIVFFV